MNLLQLIFKQMRQRALSTFLTIFSILLGMGLATSILIVHVEGEKTFANTDFGCNLIVGPKGDPLQITLNTIYHIGNSPGNIPYSVYEDMIKTADGKVGKYHGLVEWAVPYAVGDSFKGRRIVGTTPLLFGCDNDTGKPLAADKVAPEYHTGEHYSFAEGRCFHPWKFEAVLGSEVAKNAGLGMGSTFHPTHGFPGPHDIPDIHPETWVVVGVLNQTHTANDKCLFIPLPTFYAIFEHEEGLETINKIKEGTSGTPHIEAPPPAPATVTAPGDADRPDEGYITHPDGTITPKLPKKEWEVSAILVKTYNGYTMSQLQNILRNLPDAVAVSPAKAMIEFFDQFLSGFFNLLTAISALVTIIAAVSILVSIYNSVIARNREIAIMRALGATKRKILAIVCLEAGLVGTGGGILGILAGHALAAAASFFYLRLKMGSGIPWWHISALWQTVTLFGFSFPVPDGELLYLIIVIAVSLIAGLVPALKAYRTPVAENLVGG